MDGQVRLSSRQNTPFRDVRGSPGHPERGLNLILTFHPYKELVEKRELKEDVSFRRVVRKVSVDMILEAVGKVAGCGKEHLRTQRRDSRWRAAAGLLLCKYGGMTQRDAARILGLKCGSAVSVQVRKLREKVAEDSEMRMALTRLERRLAAKQR